MRNKRIIWISLLVGILSISAVKLKGGESEVIKQLEIFYGLFKELNYFYVDETNPKQLVEDAINGMLYKLDPYTSFIPEQELDDFKFMTTGKYGGVGALISTAGDYTIISEPYEGFPAQLAGVMAGDTIIEVDGKSIKGLNIRQVSDRLKGEPDSHVKIKVRRYGVPKDLKIKINRKQIKINNVPYYGVLSNKVGYIKIANFTRDASVEVFEAMNQLKAQGIESLILDLRGNPGGLLIEAVKIVNLFIPKNKEVVSTRGKSKRWDKTYYTELPSVDTIIPLAVMVNGISASASEIVSGALQDYDRAVVIGERTFGKGLVQTTRPLPYNATLKVTTSKYYIPSGRCIQSIDYFDGKDGKAREIPDSLISEFKTANGRSVFDGGGIMPDIETKAHEYARISKELYSEKLFFDFATIFRHENPSIASVDSFVITENIMGDFVAFARKHEFKHKSLTDHAFEKFVQIAKKEEKYDQAEEIIDELESKLSHDLKDDVMAYEEEIKMLLKDELVLRYYYQKGQIRSSVLADKEVAEAIITLASRETLSKILTP